LETKELIDILKLQAKEIANEGHNGWSNTMLFAALHLEKLEAQTDKGGQAEVLVMPKIADVVNNMKKKIWSSLSEYLSGENVPPERIQILNLMAENECRICDELLTEIKSNFTA